MPNKVQVCHIKRRKLPMQRFISNNGKTMTFSRRFTEKKRRLIPILILLSVSISIYYSFNPRIRAIFPSIEPIDSSVLLAIHGNIKFLGKAHLIYIINLPTRFDRRTTSIALIQAINLQAYLFPAYSIHSSEVFQRNQNRNTFFFKSTELACWASHMRVWKTIAQRTNDQDWSIIFEDDIDLEFNIHSIMQTFPSSIWNQTDLIYLGHCANPPGKLIHQSTTSVYEIREALHPSCTHAYAIRRQAAMKMIHLLSEPTQPIDDSIVELVKQQQLIAYSIHPPLVIQNPVTKTNPSDVNRINRQTFFYKLQLAFYTLMQWWNGVDLCQKLMNSTLKQANLTQADQWRQIHEQGIWKNR